jgi:transcriptional adapter 3
LQKKDVPKLSKKKKKPLAGAAAASAAAAAANAELLENGSGPPPPCPAALGLTPDDDLNLTVSDQLKTYVETRMQWVTEVGSVFDELQKANPGRIWGFPMESIYTGIEEEVGEKLARENRSVGGSGGSGSPMKVDKGKGRVVDSDAMDIG